MFNRRLLLDARGFFFITDTHFCLFWQLIIYTHLHNREMRIVYTERSVVFAQTVFPIWL